jgi:hypothetical protein
MQIPREAVEKAIEGGWKPDVNDLFQSSERQTKIALDPSFWQALGKALGWGETEVYSWDGKPTLTMYWRLKADRFYDLILKGLPHEGYNECGTAFIGEPSNEFVNTFSCKCLDKFWEEILKN